MFPLTHLVVVGVATETGHIARAALLHVNVNGGAEVRLDVNLASLECDEQEIALSARRDRCGEETVSTCINTAENRGDSAGTTK